MSTALSDSYIADLEKEKRELLNKIEELRKSVRTIDGLIIKRKSELSAGLTGVKITRKNAEKLFFETMIKEAIIARKNGARTSEIYAAILNRGQSINYNTLRARVASMRDAGIIKKHKLFPYHWIATDEKSAGT